MGDTAGMSEILDPLSLAVGRCLSAAALRLTTAESCTGGWLAKVVTDVPGSSGWFDRGFVTYDDRAKVQMLGVQVETITGAGAVSEAVVREMALGALAHSEAQIAIAITGIAGPGGGSDEKPVGTVWFAWALVDGQVVTQRLQFAGHRDEVRHQAVRVALERLIELLGPCE
ncbi:nicotinamide-nucleotide amidase [Thioalkalicoccus limnaeus]|uniref:Nicotinamide-nucleotide amidase n=1 Tax=Thioalkalicoccus limnaeus TaxID=120681 RepID=A0ABV4BCT0_9GAMM